MVSGRQAKSTARSGDEAYIRFSNVKENIKLDTSQFALKLPKDVKVMRVTPPPADVIKKPADTVNKPKKKVKRRLRAPAKPSRLKSRTSKPII
jgi:hypothetical protein